MIDAAMCWIEKYSAPEADLFANQVELAWLIRYALPYKLIVDKDEKGFWSKFKYMMANYYGIPCARNLQTNAIVRKVHQSIDNIIRVLKYKKLI